MKSNIAKSKAAENGESNVVAKCDNLYWYLFDHNKQYNALFLNIE